METNDWRLQGQENYLKGVTLIYHEYCKYAGNDNWDHDHCEFCNSKFSLDQASDTLREGYSTEDNYHWICKKCFVDFKSSFEWKLKSNDQANA